MWGYRETVSLYFDEFPIVAHTFQYARLILCLTIVAMVHQ